MNFISQSYGDMWAKLGRAFEIWSGLGMTATGVRTCGDYMFSGHTVILTILNFFITECKYQFYRYLQELFAFAILLMIFLKCKL